jgi:hypothetical protein
MLKIFLLSVILTSSIAIAQDATEEAIILNQELQFLEDSAKNVTLGENHSNTKDEFTRTATSKRSLENEYFGNDSEESISTKAAAPKRRSF